MMTHERVTLVPILKSGTGKLLTFGTRFKRMSFHTTGNNSARRMDFLEIGSITPTTTGGPSGIEPRTQPTIDTTTRYRWMNFRDLHLILPQKDLEKFFHDIQFLKKIPFVEQEGYNFSFGDF